MSHFKLDRRRFISSTGLVLTLPFLESIMPFSKAFAATGGPGRAVWLYMPDGTYNKSNDAPWYPAKGKLTQTLPDVLSPFASRIADFSVLMYLKNNSRDVTDGNYYKFNGNGGGHVSAISTYLSAQIITTPSSKSCSIARPSVDQVIGQAANKVVLNMHAGGLTSGADGSPFDYSNYISFLNGKPVQPMSNPHDVYNKLFAMVAPASTPAAPSISARQKSILDASIGDIGDLKKQLGKTDSSKLDDYLTSVRNLETKLSAQPVTNSCTPPAAPTINNFGGENVADYIKRVQTYFDMIAFAFQCDLARSVTFMFDGEVGERQLGSQVPSNLVYPNGQLDAGMHIGIAHNGGRTKNITKDRVYMSLMFYLVDKLKAAIDSGGGPILDNTLIHMGYGVSAGDHGDGHSPHVLAGGRNLVSPGNCYDVSAYDQKDLLYTIAAKMNVGITSFEGSSKLVPV